MIYIYHIIYTYHYIYIYHIIYIHNPIQIQYRHEGGPTRSCQDFSTKALVRPLTARKLKDGSQGSQESQTATGQML